MNRILLAGLLLAASFQSLGQTKAKARLQFDGFYQSKIHIDTSGSDNYYYYLRFYADGNVVATSSTGSADDLKKWFNINHKYSSHGKHKLSGARLSFSATSDKGTVVYDGKISGNNSELLRKSLINGFSGTETYHFIKIPNLE